MPGLHGLREDLVQSLQNEWKLDRLDSYQLFWDRQNCLEILPELRY